MDWNAAIEKHREALKHILATLVAMAGLGGQFTFFPQEGASPGGLAQAEKNKLSPALPRHLRLAVLRLLRPAESAARRLIIALARGLVVTLPPPRKAPQAGKTRIVPTILSNGVGTGIAMPSAAPGGSSSARAMPRALSLPLFDPLQHPFRPRPPKQNGVPRISLPGFTEPFPVADRRPPAPNDAVDAGRLGRRLEALGRALDDLPRQALRFARWRVRRDAVGARDRGREAAGAQNKPRDADRIRRLWPLRMGRPPGSRRRPSHEVHDVLTAAHGLAFWALEHPDTS
ncbi:hypothetical protein [Allomesorhizobium camelthorni]|uniref:Uncharacterized protein n=1 Tax=Allomesorhizobium camelthorni TaxID=475069 RepID=A0A6G4WAE9_9HYPH|nr:hypothetical protein [Mesorhizobium camelthorni]NGO51554.1 hypothetical protein [Mesorhizobium camelthorni]